MQILDFFMTLICRINVKKEKQILLERTSNIIKKDHIALKATNVITRDDLEVQEETIAPVVETNVKAGVKIKTKVMVSNTVTRFISKIKKKKGEDEDDNNNTWI